MCQRMDRSGNPKTYATYHDESVNGILAVIARSVHSATFWATAHFKYHAYVCLQGLP
jgi:hypothetical protein